MQDIPRLFQVPDLGREAMPVPDKLYASKSTSGRSARSGYRWRTDFTGSHDRTHDRTHVRAHVRTHVRAHDRAHDRARFD